MVSKGKLGLGIKSPASTATMNNSLPLSLIVDAIQCNAKIVGFKAELVRTITAKAMASIHPTGCENVRNLAHPAERPPRSDIPD